MSEEMKLHCAPANGSVVTVIMNLALEAQTPEKGQRVTQGPAGQNWNCDFVLLQDVCDVECCLTTSSPTAAVNGLWQRIQRPINTVQSKPQRRAAVRVERFVGSDHTGTGSIHHRDFREHRGKRRRILHG